MNSEELEQSLRTEFESYLKGVLSDIREDVDGFREKIEAEFEKHRTQVNSAFAEFSGRFDTDHEFDIAFRESVLEHLRLARDEGAKITATAIAEAEDLERAASPAMDLSEIKDAIADISSKDSQSSILRSLINNAAKFTPRGAFFIVKNEHFVGWKLFGAEADENDPAIRDIHFPMSDDSILNAAAQSLSLAEGSFGTYPDDVNFLDPLQFGRPDRMYAIPLVARGRGVAVLYADYGHEGVTVNTDALEVLVRVAGLTVEMLAAAKTSRGGADAHAHTDLSEADDRTDSDTGHDERVATPYYDHSASTDDDAGSDDHYETLSSYEPEPEPERSFANNFGMAPEYVPDEVEETDTQEFEPPSVASAPFETSAEEPVQETSFETEPATPSPESMAFESFHVSNEPETTSESEPEPGLNEAAIVFDSPAEDEGDSYEQSPFDQPAESFEPSVMGGERVQTHTAPAVETVTSAPKATRLSDRNVDLPIEVADDERRLHNDARRFARLLVSEIKLYNEKKVQEGREASDLYERLREAIDRSREMYDKRVQPPVASKFDYFHYELINALADGDVSRLGNSYPGATV